MEAFEVLGLAVLLAIVLIYMIMASQFQSLSYPFIIMFTIPLAFTGGFLILFFAGMPISVVSLIGLIVLTGVVVNNGIVLVDYTNQLRLSGYEIKDALLEAGKTRMRPIIMTALTTIGGLLYATILTLVVVPLMYYFVTKYAKLFLSVLLILVSIAAGIALYYFYGSILYIIGAIALAFGVMIFLVLTSKKRAVIVE